MGVKVQYTKSEMSARLHCIYTGKQTNFFHLIVHSIGTGDSLAQPRLRTKSGDTLGMYGHISIPQQAQSNLVIFCNFMYVSISCNIIQVIHTYILVLVQSETDKCRGIHVHALYINTMYVLQNMHVVYKSLRSEKNLFPIVFDHFQLVKCFSCL